MSLSCLYPLASWFKHFVSWRNVWVRVLSLVMVLSMVNGAMMPAAIAGLNDDRYDGDIFTLYAGNGSIVPPKVTMEQAFQRKSPTLLILYVDDSSDCKLYSTTISQLQAFYGRVSDFLPVRVDSIPPQDSYTPTEAGYYYKGVVPQTVLFDENGKAVLNEKGILTFEKLDDKFRQLFELLPRTESVTLKRRSVNEINTELVK